MGRDALDEVSESAKIEYLKRHGWYSWYHKDYWCHPTKTTTDRLRQDHTNYGMSLSEAYTFEINGGTRNE